MKVKGVEITADAVKEAYAKLGLKPVSQTYYNGKGCCALTALYLANGGDVYVLTCHMEDGIHPNQLFEMDEADMMDFISGFDGEPQDGVFRQQSFNLGVAIRKEVLCEKPA